MATAGRFLAQATEAELARDLGESVTTFTFKAPTLYEAAAVPDDNLRGALHDSPAMAGHLARIKKFALWLEAEIDRKGFVLTGPFADEGGWILEVPSNKGFVVSMVTGPDGDDTNFHILVAEYNGATNNVCGAIEQILRDAGEISELKVKK